MKLLTGLLTTGLLLTTSFSPAQTTPHQTAPARTAAARPPLKVPPFSGTWNLDLRRSKLETARPSGLGQVVIDYDGKTWRYKHTHLNGEGQIEDSWDTTLVVGSMVLHVEKEEPLTFRSRIYKEGDTMVLLDFVRTDRGKTSTNTIRYSLEEGGKTLIESEKSVGPLGTQINRWVLERVPEGTAAPFSQSRDPDGSDSR